MSKKIYLAASACVATLMMTAAASATPNVTFYGTFADTVSNVSAVNNSNVTIPNANGPSVPTNGSSFTISNNGNTQVLMSVDPASCIGQSNCGSGTETANINVTLDFYSTSNHSTLLGTVTDTAQSMFFYTGNNSGTDNLCWLNGSVGGTATVSHSAVGAACPGSTSGYEQIVVSLGGNSYDLDLYNWSDWDETPNISLTNCVTNCGGNPNGNPVPEPFTLSLFGAGLAGAAALRRRKQKKAA